MLDGFWVCLRYAISLRLFFYVCRCCIINKRTSQRVKLPEGVFDMTTAVHGVYEEQT